MCPLKEAAEQTPDRPAFNGTSFYELDVLADTFVFQLEKTGVRLGDRIVFRHPPCIEVAALFFAAWRIGASICPLSLRIPLSQIEFHLDRLQAKVYIDAFPILAHRCKGGPPLPFSGALLFTSGSTSMPKIAVLSLSNLLDNAFPAISHLDLREGDRWFLNLPLFHVGGIGILLRCVLAKACVASDSRDPAITHISVVPTQLFRATPAYRNLKCLLIGGAPIPSYPERLPCFLSYGLTEMASLVTVNFNPPRTGEPYALGPPLLNREVRLSNENEILVRGSCLFQGYWENGDILRPFDAEGWFATGDIGRISREGLTVIGRKDWQFISGGENIQPEEIENVLLSLPGVSEAVVLPLDDPEFGQRPIAILKAEECDSARLKDALLEKLPKFKIPVRFFFVDAFPKNGLKINRKAVKNFNSFARLRIEPI